MTLPTLYWILMLLMFLFGVWNNYPFTSVRPAGAGLILFILLVMLGLAQFGPPIHR